MVGSMLLVGANVHSRVDGLSLEQRIEFARSKVQPEDSAQREKLDWIVSRLNAHGAGIPDETTARVERSKEHRHEAAMRPPFSGKEKNAELHLHTAVETLDFTWAEKLLKQRADVHSIIGGCTLKQRIEQMRKDVYSDSQFAYVVRERRKQPALIEEMAVLLRAHGADV